MTADLEASVVAGCVFADDCRVAARPGRGPKVSDAELVALAVCQAAIGISSDREFLGPVERCAARLVFRLAGAVPGEPSAPPPGRADLARAVATRPLAGR